MTDSTNRPDPSSAFENTAPGDSDHFFVWRCLDTHSYQLLEIQAEPPSIVAVWPTESDRGAIPLTRRTQDKKIHRPSELPPDLRKVYRLALNNTDLKGPFNYDERILKASTVEVTLKRCLTHGKEYLARITGSHPRYRFQRTFLVPDRRDWTRSGRQGTTTFVVEEEGYYEQQNPDTGLYGAEARSYWRYKDGVWSSILRSEVDTIFPLSSVEERAKAAKEMAQERRTAIDDTIWNAFLESAMRNPEQKIVQAKDSDENSG